MVEEGKFTTTEDDLVKGNRLHARQVWTRRGILKGWIIGTIILVCFGFGVFKLTDWHLALAPIIAAVFMGVGFVLSGLAFTRSARLNFRQMRKFFLPTSFEWDSDKICFASDRGSVTFSWSDFYAWAADETSILLYQAKNFFITVPTRDLSCEAPESIVSALRAAGVPKRSLL